MKKKKNQSISTKVARVRNIILILLLLILARIWHVAVFQHEEKVEASRKPQRRHLVEKADRATITDRFGEPLALNKIQYNASVSYGGIREVPRTVWCINEEGQKVKISKRKEYITHLSSLLAKELDLDATRIEDLIHSKASVFGNVPFVVKENISEETYFRIKMLEKDCPGLLGEKVAKRFYPQQFLAGEVIGYLGAISKNEYEKILREMETLQNYLTAWEEGNEISLPTGYHNGDEVKRRLKTLESKAYTLNDKVGKAGVEKTFDEKLRGASGSKVFLSDIKGNFLTKLPGGREKETGHHLTLSISLELQKEAEKLLAEYEAATLSQNLTTQKMAALFPKNQPWIKGGAIVALNPVNGEIYALATYPRFNPNDFIEKNEKIERWLESETYVGAIWDQKEKLFRERFDHERGIFVEETSLLTWNEYLHMVLPGHSIVLKKMETCSVQLAYTIQSQVDKLLSLYPGIMPAKVFDFIWSEEALIGIKPTLPEKEKLVMQERSLELKKALQPYFSNLSLNYEKLLFVDLCRLALNPSRFSQELLEKVGDQSLDEYRNNSALVILTKEALQKELKELFHEIDFKKWRETHFKEYLTQKRKEEELRKRRSGRPYIEYLDEKEETLFEEFWKKYWSHFLAFILTKEQKFLTLQMVPYVKPHCMKLKTNPSLPKLEGTFLLQYLKTFESYGDLNRLVLGNYGFSGLKNLARAFYPKYGFGFARSQAFRKEASVGSVFKLVPAYEALRQKYLKNPRDLSLMKIIDDKHKSGNVWNVGFTLDGDPIPRYYRGGQLPRSEHSGIGEVDLVKALAVSSNPYFAMLTGDCLNDPEDLCKAAALFSYGEKTGIDLPGEIKGNIPNDVTYNRTGLYSFSIGQHTLFGSPLQIGVMLSTLANGGKVVKPKILLREDEREIPTVIQREIFLPKPIRDTLLKGLKQVIMSEQGTARILKQQFPEELLSCVVGKTSTAEAIERISLDGTHGRLKCKHVSFGAIHFEKSDFEKPSLVVVVYLRYGEYGWKAAPYAMKMIKKWKEISLAH